ncbi:sel1 repeat family protein [Rubrivivax rivuli]|uniref:Sel1 repeat family protein n=2 Tax=Rubrivivax rivuli TaxID=1862385 RepID=A0A437REF6_9BURK|nr:sel1 repeat family protein [Rubrivivax rivuli]
MNGYRAPTQSLARRRKPLPRFAPPWSFTMFHALARLALRRAALQGARLLVLATLASPVMAAAPLPPALQNELDRAVIAYESGQLPAAQKAFEALARRGVAAAQYNLAVMHLQGEVPKPDRTRARGLLQQAAEGGFVTAQFMLAQALENGELGPRDLALAHRWYEVAAEAGSTEAQLAMGTGHYLGRGLPKDAARAVHWFREAAKGGDVGAMYLLASMYEQGDGVERDLRLARYWYGVAAQNGDRAAPGKLREIDVLLGSQPS